MQIRQSQPCSSSGLWHGMPAGPWRGPLSRGGGDHRRGVSGRLGGIPSGFRSFFRIPLLLGRLRVLTVAHMLADVLQMRSNLSAAAGLHRQPAAIGVYLCLMAHADPRLLPAPQPPIQPHPNCTERPNRSPPTSQGKGQRAQGNACRGARWTIFQAVGVQTLRVLRHQGQRDPQRLPCSRNNLCAQAHSALSGKSLGSHCGAQTWCCWQGLVATGLTVHVFDLPCVCKIIEPNGSCILTRELVCELVFLICFVFSDCNCFF